MSAISITKRDRILQVRLPGLYHPLQRYAIPLLGGDKVDGFGLLGRLATEKGELHDVRKHGVLVDDDNEALATIVAVLLQCICLSN